MGRSGDEGGYWGVGKKPVSGLFKERRQRTTCEMRRGCLRLLKSDAHRAPLHCSLGEDALPDSSYPGNYFSQRP